MKSLLEMMKTKGNNVDEKTNLSSHNGNQYGTDLLYDPAKLQLVFSQRMTSQ